MMRAMDDVARAAALGFKRPDAEQALAILDAVQARLAFDVAMDLARFVRIPLVDATWALVIGPKRLRRLGIVVPPSVDPLDYVRDAVVGQAKAYAGTFYGTLDVREAQGHTFTRVFLDFVERVFGPR